MAGHEVQVGAATVDRRAKGEIAAGPRLAAGVVVVLVGIQRRRPDRLHHRLKSRPRSDERFGPFAVPTPDMRGRLHDRQEEPDDQDGHRHGHEEFEQGEGPPGHAGATAPAQMAGGRPGSVRCHRWFIAGARGCAALPRPATGGSASIPHLATGGRRRHPREKRKAFWEFRRVRP